MSGNSSTPCGSYVANPSFFGFNRPCDGSSVQIYQAFTECLPSVTIRLQSFSSCPITLIVKHNEGQQQVQIEPNQQFFYAYFECVKEVKFQCSNSPEGNCSFSGEIQVIGCVSCCESGDESSDESSS